MMYILDIGYCWGSDLITRPYLFSSIEAAKAAIDKLLPGVVWEYHNDYAVAPLHQFKQPVQFKYAQNTLDVFQIVIRPAQDVDTPLPYSVVMPTE